MYKDINIICNNCVGGFLYNTMEMQYNNPFIWSSVMFETFVNIITNFENIDFSNYKIGLEENDHLKGKDSVFVQLPNIGKIHYIHLIQNSEYVVPTKVKWACSDRDIHYNNILEYAKQQYDNRINRMTTNFQFIYSFNYAYDKINEETYLSRFNKLVELSNNRKLMVIINDKCPFIEYAKTKESKNLHIVILSRYECLMCEISHRKKVLNEFMTFFEMDKTF